MTTKSSFLFPVIKIVGRASAAVKVTVESVVESIVSRYEEHFKPSRQPTEEHSLDKMVIAEYGPTSRR